MKKKLKERVKLIVGENQKYEFCYNRKVYISFIPYNIKMVNKNNLVKCHWCKNKIEADEINNFILYDRRLHCMVEKHLCGECQRIFDSRDENGAMKLRKLKLIQEKKYGK